MVGEAEGTSVEDAKEALLNLRNKGFSLGDSIFRDFVLLGRLFEQQFALTSFDEVPLVELSGAGSEYIPIELLPVFWWRWPPEIATAQDLLDAARTFLGLAAVVRRTVDAPVSQETCLAVGAKLPIRLFWFAAMNGANVEREYLEAHESIDLRGPWPDGELQKTEALKVFARHVWDPRRASTGEGRLEPDRVHHYACHHQTAFDPWDSAIHLRGVSGPTHEISLEMLNGELYPFRMREERSDRSKPLVFVNACGSSTVSADSAAALPTFFIENGNVGFIGTETRVPDQFASEFARRFYDNLVIGHSVGRSLHSAKVGMLVHEHNPLGILYTLYGNPDLAIELDPNREDEM